MEFVHRDQAVSALYIEDKLSRQASHGLGRSLVTQLEGLFPDPLKRGKLDADVLVAAHTSPHMQTMVNDDAEMIVRNGQTGQENPVFPETFDMEKHLVINHTIDRGGIGGALLRFMISMGYLWASYI